MDNANTAHQSQK